MRPFITSMRTLAMSVPSLVLSLMKEDRVIGCWLGVIYSGGNNSTRVLLESRAVKLTERSARRYQQYSRHFRAQPVPYSDTWSEPRIGWADAASTLPPDQPIQDGLLTKAASKRPCYHLTMATA